MKPQSTIRYQQQILSDKKINKIVEKLKSEISETTQADYKEFDFHAEIDRTLAVNEATENLRNKLTELGYIKPFPTREEYQAEKIRITEEQEQALKEHEEEIKKQIEEYNKSIVSDNKKINDFYYGLTRRIELLAKGHFNILIIRGSAGIGKSYQTTAKLNELKKDYLITQGKITPAMLYRRLYEANREKKIPIFRDTTLILETPSCIDILKAYCDDNRVVHNLTYGKQQLDIPPSFIGEQPVIFEVNRMNYSKGIKDDVDALVSRGQLYRLILSRDDMICIMRSLATEDWQKTVVEYLISKSENSGISFNLRQLNQAWKIYQASIEDKKEWKREIDILLEDSKTEGERLLYEFAGKRAVKKADFVKFVARKMGFTLRRAQMVVRDWIDLEDIFAEGSMVSINKIEVK